MFRIKAIIFDCFGVLITDALTEMVRALEAGDPTTAADIVDVIKAANFGVITPDESREKVAQLLGLTADQYVQRIRDGEVKNHALLAYIAQLRSNYKTAILSNVSSRGLEVRFAPDELEKHFDVVVASGAIGVAKPNPEAYEITADKLGLRCDECVMVDDREDYLVGAREADMQAVLYTTLPELQADLSKLL